MGCALGEVLEVKEYVAGLEVYPTGRCSLLDGLRINSQSSDHLEFWSFGEHPLVFGVGDEFNIIGIQ